MTYHMRRKDRAITDRSAIEAIIRQHRYAVIALCRDNEPYIVALDYGFDAENTTLYFHCAKEGKKIDFIRANPKACATIIADSDPTSLICDHTYRSVVLYGTIEIVDEKQKSDKAISLMIEQLEKPEPEKFRGKLNTSDKSYVNLRILRMKIEEMTGKERVVKGRW
jgi:nitroimidazol reductase NimA-like FMN-containing flavoprotein (pyridoxamine 5'-phosphate oxidase superfamily)